MHDVEGDARTLPDDRTYDTVTSAPRGDHGPDAQSAVFPVLDRAQIGFELKGAAFDAVRSSTSDAGAAVALQGLDLSTALLGALGELLLAE